MTRKLSLQADDLKIDSFQTGQGVSPERGTVHGAQACTGYASCYCATSLYQCGTLHATYSCPVTFDC